MQSPRYLSSPEWTDDQKASVLFAPFRDKALNPTSWERKMNFWMCTLLEHAHIENDLILDLKTFTNYFERHGKRPKCLATVVKEMVTRGKLKSLSDFQRQGGGWVHWGFNTFIRRPAAWGFSKLLPANDSVETDVFINVEQLQRKSLEVLAFHHSRVQHETTDHVMELAQFRALCLQFVKTEAECDVIIKQLELDGRVMVTITKDGNKIIKICNASETKVQTLQEIELNIFRIRKVMTDLEQQIETLAAQSDCHTSEARKLVAQQKKALALHQLRKRRTLQRQIEKKSSCIDTLHDIIHRIEDSTSNEMVVKAYESGVSAIRQLTGDRTIDKVDKVLDDLQQVLEDQQEISESIAGVKLPGVEDNADALEVELDKLLAEDGEMGQKQSTVADGAKGDMPMADLSTSGIDDLISSLAEHTLDDLPDVPTSSPGTRDSGKSSQKQMRIGQTS